MAYVPKRKLEFKALKNTLNIKLGYTDWKPIYTYGNEEELYKYNVDNAKNINSKKLFRLLKGTKVLKCSEVIE